MRDGRPNPDIWGNIITCGEIAVGIYEIVGTKKRGLEIPKAVAEEILPESVMEQATQDGEALCFTDPVSNAIVADALLEQELEAQRLDVALLLVDLGIERRDALRQLRIRLREGLGCERDDLLAQCAHLDHLLVQERELFIKPASH